MALSARVLRVRHTSWLWLVALSLVAGIAHATATYDDVIELDGARSDAQFRIKAVWLLGVHGYFTSVGGRVQINHANGLAMVDARIQANAVRMNLRGYEDWVKSAEFFDVAAHPEIRFVSNPFPMQRLQDGGALPGTLTLRGISASVQFRLEAASCAQPGYTCAIVANAAIQRSSFGMRSRLGTLGDKVQLSFEAYLKPSALQSSR